MSKMPWTTFSGDIYWACTNTKNQLSNCYQVDICNLSNEDIKKAEELGLRVRYEPEKKPDQGHYITAKSKLYEIVVVDKNGEVIKDKVANGSKGSIGGRPYAYKVGINSGVSLGASKLTVNELVKYEAPLTVNDLEDDVL